MTVSKAAAWSLVSNCFDLIREDQDYVYFSNGGHLENLGIYEMVRRHSRFVVVSDAGCDPNFAFEILATRFIIIKLIRGSGRFDGLAVFRPRPFVGRDLGSGHPYHAIGEVDYPAAYGGDKSGIISDLLT